MKHKLRVGPESWALRAALGLFLSSVCVIYLFWNFLSREEGGSVSVSRRMSVTSS